jgi:GMP synthase (glutamine-hydrolysing)
MCNMVAFFTMAAFAGIRGLPESATNPVCERMARPKILVFQHVPYEPLGTLDPLLKEAGFRIRYVNFGRDPHQRPTLDKYEALIVLGGPMNAHQIDTYPNLATEVDVIREAVDAGMSVLGICLGAQLLAKAIGGRVSRNDEREIGWYDVNLTEAGRADPVISAFASTQTVFQWHEDGISLPAGVPNLATSPASPVQAFRYGEHAYGFQFHLEVDASLVERWLTVEANRPILAAEAGRVDPDLIRQQTNERIRALQELSRQTFSRWIDRFDIAPRRRALPSR